VAGETILVVEDDVSVRELLETALRSRGYVVHACADGLVGLTTLEQVRPHLMIVDIMMPRLDGMTFVRAIKSKAEMKRIPVIFLTAKSDARSMIDGINLGAKYYVTKPFEVEGLLSKIAKALV
jgi:DNA-binding response OmpR family regulator